MAELRSASAPDRVVRLVTGRPPWGARGIVLVLVLLTAVCGSQPLAASASLAPAAVATVLAALWFGRAAVLAVLAGAVLALQPLPPALPDRSSLLTGAVAVLGLGLVAAVVRGCSAGLSHARAAAQKQLAARGQETRAAQRQEQELTGQLNYWATHDALTGTLNRGAFCALVSGSVSGGQPTAVLVIAVSGFAAVNETYGHDVGDAALVLLAQRLTGATRGTDVVARVGGDAFAVLLAGVRSADAEAAAARMLEAVSVSVAAGEHSVPLRMRAGLAVEADGNADGAQLVRCAEAAVREATAGRMPRVWTGGRPTVDDGPAEADLARGLAAGELFLLYQPLVCTRTGRMRSVEALVRWQHPQRGLVPPDAFIGLAERTGLIVPLGLHVLQLACTQLSEWSQTAPGLTVAVNVSARQLVEDGFVDDVRRILWSSRIDPSRVVLELTESLLVDDSDAAVAVLWQLRGLGVRLALDDFGTGYSSLARLGELPLDEMKIDKSFVDRLGAQPHDSTSLLTAAVAMGHGLGLEVVAEGVETAAQAAFLRDVKCDLLQGYLFSRPQSAADLAPLMDRVLLAGSEQLPGPRTAAPTVRAVVVPAVMPAAPRR